MEAEYDQAYELFKKVSELYPDEPTAAQFLAEWAQQHNDSTGAVYWSKTLKKLQPLNPASYRILTGAYLEEKNDELALPELLELARQDEHDSDVPRQIARIYRDRGQLQVAVSWYRQSIYIDPYHVRTLQELAELYSKLQNHSEAQKVYRALTLVEPDKARHHSDLAFSYMQSGQQAEAKEAAARAVQIDPNSPARELLGK